MLALMQQKTLSQNQVPSVALTSENEETSYEAMVYQKMFSPEGLRLASSYLNEEEAVVKQILLAPTSSHITHIVVVGAGPLRYCEIASSKSYTAVDPYLDRFLENCLSDVFRSRKSVRLINQAFEDIAMDDLPLFGGLYIFTFNVISYMKQADNALRKIPQNNLVLITAWHPNGYSVMHNYLTYVYGKGRCLKQATEFVDPHTLYKAQKHTFAHVEKQDHVFTKSLIIHT